MGSTAILPCVALIKGQHFCEEFENLSWNSRSSPTEKWNFIGGVNSSRHVYIPSNHSESPRTYDIDWRGFLVIRNVSNAENNTEYRCTVKKVMFRDPYSSFVILSAATGERLFFYNVTTYFARRKFL